MLAYLSAACDQHLCWRNTVCSGGEWRRWRHHPFQPGLRCAGVLRAAPLTPCEHTQYR